MLKASELRIGNKIFIAGIDYDAGENKFNDPDGDEMIDVTIDVLKDIIDNQADYKAIPLTPEILEAVGFVKDRSGWQMQGTQFSLTDKFFPCWMDRMLWPQDIPDFKMLSLKYLHQIQNLYHALTGRELEIKELI